MFYKTATTILSLVISLGIGSANADNKQIFEGQVVNGVIDIKNVPTKIHTGSIVLKYQEEQDDEIQAQSIQLATIGISQAILIAETAYPGIVVEAELDNEDDFLVWDVEVINTNHPHERIVLTIDAGNGRLLAVDTDD